MLCKCFRAADASEPTAMKYKRSGISDESQEQPFKIKKPIELSLQDDEEGKIIKFINQTIHEEDHFVEIIDADPQAFDSVFIQQRQNAINNQLYRSTIESWQFKSLRHLVNAIKNLTKNKSLIDCHWIIFYSIAINIEYDTIAYFSNNHINQSAEDVFLARKGICNGYVHLYKYLCDRLKLPCKIINGYSKGYGFDIRSNASNQTDHAWNAVQINQHWYLIDSTWGAGFINDRKDFKRELNPFYFFPRPQQMIYHHLPENYRWQLLQEPISMKQFLKMPNLHPEYFNLNLQLIYPCNQSYVQLLPDKPYALVIVDAPENVSLTADLKLHDKKVEGGHQVMFDQKRKLFCCYFAPNAVGKHKVTIYAKCDDQETDLFISTIDLNLDIEELPKNPISYSRTWKLFFDLHLKIISPVNVSCIRLEKGEAFTQILIESPDDVELLGRLVDGTKNEIEGGHQVYYDADKHYWICYFAPNDDGLFEAIIMAKQKFDQGLYTSVVAFKIDAKDIPKPAVSYPETWKLFHDLHLQVMSPINTHTIQLDNGDTFAQILIQTPDDVELLGMLRDNEKNEVDGGHQVYYDHKEHYWQCVFAPNDDGIFKADIMAKRKSDQGLYTSAVAFKIIAKNIPKPPLSYPKTWQLFHDLDLKIDEPYNRSTVIWSDQALYAEIRITTPEDIELLCKIAYNNIEEEHQTLTQFDHEKKQWQLLFAPQQTGQHQLTIFARHQSDLDKKFNIVAQFNLNVTSLENPIKFPLTYDKFIANRCRIYESLNGILKNNTIIPFHCVIPGAKEVKVQVDGKWIDTQNSTDSIFQTQVQIGSNDVTIYGKYDHGNNYDALIKYSVQ
ncbi:unnamed protein product [Adineta steineri]|uniref:Transglutaminase-like domain-containing protein n=3 Tax=Adineta steineri TaxID=433720 RepID=A0A814V3B3_9BILA|nr:unnamed protein product [Adineta steineri]CAF4060505.1 unnamed protein product [Adineta steineri]